MVYYYSGGLRLNPNLYECGKVCLSLLGTWSGHNNENWIPGKSTMLQVLVSIQALILNAKPFFNEPGHESSYTGAEGESRSIMYNEDVFILSLKTMVYILRRPPKVWLQKPLLGLNWALRTSMRSILDTSNVRFMRSILVLEECVGFYAYVLAHKLCAMYVYTMVCFENYQLVSLWNC